LAFLKLYERKKSTGDQESKLAKEFTGSNTESTNSNAKEKRRKFEITIDS
jgi:hypothetical protein